ncbi:MAG: translocation/assembly module TamB domain-containing protein [Gammaproteobacteria bacterium]|nr:translocation/assembly module TamB domain-containing protein [Gammaproteobacteria bacterium]MCH9744999.1 translocation/assembly module TamB domain-containing protein [Gammaproteobacteria bacterium]
MRGKIFRNCIRSLVVVLLLLLLLIIFLMTPYGFTSSMWLVKRALPGELSYQHASGALAGPVNIKNFSYSTKQYTLKAKQLHFNWDPLFLAKKTLVIQELKVDHVQFVLHKSVAPEAKPVEKEPSAASANSFQLSKFSLPFRLQIENGDIKDINIVNLHQKKIHVSYLTIQGTLSNGNMNFNIRTSIAKPQPIYGSFNVVGDIKHYKLKLLVRTRALRWHLTGEGGQQHINLVTNDGHVLGGRIHGKINLNLHDGMHWQINLNVKQVKLRDLNKDYPNQINLKLQTQGNITNNSPSMTLAVAARVPSGHIHIKAHITKKIQATWDIAVKKLNDVWRPLQGALTSKGRFTGTMQHPITAGMLQLQAFQFQQYQLKKLKSHWDIKDLYHAMSTFNLAVQSLRVGKTRVPRISIALKGNRVRQHMIAAVKMTQAKIETKINGNYSKERWKLEAPKLSIQSKIFNNWSLESPLQLTWSSNGDIALMRSCLHSNSQQSICVGGNRKSGAWQLKVHGNNLKARDYLVFNHRNVKIHGRTSLNVTAEGDQSKFKNAVFKVHFDKGYVNYFLNGKQHYRLYLSGNVDGLFKDNNLKAHVQFNLQDKDVIAVDLKTDQDSDAHFSLNTPLDGKVNIAIHNLGVISNYIPSIGITDGFLRVNVGVGGTFGDPLYNGNVRLRTAILSIPSAGLRLTQLALDFKVVNSVAHAVVHTLSSGNPVKVEGTADFNRDTFGTKLHLTGNSALVVNMPRYKVFATPDIKFSYAHHQASIRGTLTIPAATLKLQRSTSVVSMPTHEIEYVGPDIEQTHASTIFDLDCNIQIEKAVRIEAYGLSANLEGKLHLFTSDKGVLLANGRIAVLNGEFAAYGHALSIANESSIQYVQSPVENPILNVRAFKDIKVVGGLNPQQFNFENLVVGIIVTGHPSNMKVDLYSQPPGMSQEDILSYLLFGYSGGSSTGSPTQIAGALSQGGSGLSTIPNKFQQTLGLAEFGVENNEVKDAGGNRIGQQSAFVLGKQLSRQFYIRYVYNYGIYQPGSVFQIRYYLGKKWVIQADAGDYGEGMDVLYSVQSNK